MVVQNTAEEIVRELRGANKPALSASDLAELVEVSPRTINNHVGDLVDQGRIKTTQIGNANAYYIETESSEKFDYTCLRCSRGISKERDFIKLDIDDYRSMGGRGANDDDFFLFCRFCYEDFISWIFDPGAIGDYSRVHSWDIPEEQLVEVREDDSTQTAPDRDFFHFPDGAEEIFEVIEETYEETDEPITKAELFNTCVSGAQSEFKVEQLLNELTRSGFIFKQTDISNFLNPVETYKPAK